MIGTAALAFVPSPIFATGEFRMLQEKEIIWRRVMDDLSFELAYVRSEQSGPNFGGIVLIAEKGSPLRIDYRVVCDEAWRTQVVSVTQTHNGSTRYLTLEHDGHGTWRRNGREAGDLSGCTDVDLGVSPSTNALPVNRLRLEQGQSEKIRAAWVRFPSLDVEVADQSYKRLADRRYLYRSLTSGFQAKIEVDVDGFPTDYSGIWLRLAEGKFVETQLLQNCVSGFAGALVSHGPADEIADVAADFGWLIGGWDAEVFDYDEKGAIRTGTGEWWFSWVLEGRAIQDVWISPRRTLRSDTHEPQMANNRYGTSLRYFNRNDGLWQIAWTNPVSGVVNRLSGRRDGNRIVLTGQYKGDAIRWSFNNITNTSFVWVGERRGRSGDWHKEAEFRLQRMPS